MKRFLTFSILALLGLSIYAQNYGDISNVVDVDDNLYETVYLQDNNWWMLENLKVRNWPDGSAAQFVFPWNGEANDSTLVDKGAGLVYDRDMLMGYPHAMHAQGLCPNGWHIPTIEEYFELGIALGGSPTIWSWEEDFGWEQMVKALKLGETSGGKWDPSGEFNSQALTNWGPSVYVSNPAWDDRSIAHMLVIRADGGVGALTMDPSTVASACRCAKNRPLKVTMWGVNDYGLNAALSEKVLLSTEQVRVYNVSYPNEAWPVELTSVVLSEDSLSLTVSAYLEASLGEKYEVRFVDNQFKELALGGYDITIDNKTSVKRLTANNLIFSPNPATNTINFKDENIDLVEIYNLSGEKMMTHFLQGAGTINISQFQQGVYIVKTINNNGEISSNKLIKN
ncbi:MAG: T9SS type A sorting domain-containing protein [Prolixibacteraceae bacterium]